MVKKNLAVLLVVPFLVALVGVASIKSTYHLVDNDILSIEWDYNDTEAYKISDTLYPLEASYISEKNYELSPGNGLVWKVTNKNADDEETHAVIEEDGEKYYLKAVTEGEVIISCSNTKGTVSKSMNAIIYNIGAILINPEIKSSQSNIDSKIYYGEYDFDNDGRKNASFRLNVTCLPEEIESTLYVKDISSNISYNNGNVSVSSPGEAFITFASTYSSDVFEQTYSFEVVDEGYNIYTYDDLLRCSNKSENGEIGVLRKSFESLDNYKLMAANNVELFGNYSGNSFDFENEIYQFETTYNTDFIDGWNKLMKEKNGTSFISKTLKAALRIQKDFYGNGYSLNFHNLTYPKESITVSDDEGNEIEKPLLTSSDLYQGPLPFFTLGDHNNTPLIECFGQDNSGIYLDGDNITLNDINVRNCDFGSMLSNLDTVGTVIDVHGDNDVIINSRVSNGKNVIRSFSSTLSIKNCLISNARNFLLESGSDRYEKVDGSKEYSITDYDGNKTTTSVDSIVSDGSLNETLDKYLLADFTSQMNMIKALRSVNSALNDSSSVKENGNYIYSGEVNVTDTYFYRSGVSSIGMNTMFNGPYMYANLPSSVNSILAKLETADGIKLSDLLVDNVGGVAYPTKVNIYGKTKFYDFKKTDELDISGLIRENISTFASSIDPDYKGVINIDKIFPVKQYLLQQASEQGTIYSDGENEYINCAVAYYGGGLNASKVTFEDNGTDDSLKNKLASSLNVDLLSYYIILEKGSTTVEQLKNMMLKAVTVACGFEDYKFTCVKDGYLFNQYPSVNDLKSNQKGENP